MYRRPKPQLRFNVIVRYLPLHFDENDLHSLFGVIGPIISVKLMRVKTGSEGYGFVNFARQDDAQRAIEYFDGYKITDRKTLKVSWSVPGKRVGCKVFVTNIPLHWDKHDFELAFETRGRAEEVRLIGIRNGRSSGFILFFNSNYARRAIQRMNGFFPKNGKYPLRVELAIRTAQKIHQSIVNRADPSRHYVQDRHRPDFNLPSRMLEEIPDISVDASPPETSDQHRLFFFNVRPQMPKKFLKTLFEHYGEIIDLELQTDKNGQCLGMGFASFKNSKAIDLCHSGLNRAELHGQKLFIRLDI